MTDSPLASLPDRYRAVVIGTSGAIGGAIAAQIAADPRCAALYALSRAGTAAPPGARAMTADITDAASLGRAAATIGADGPIDLVFVATGLLHRGNQLQPEKGWRAITATNFGELFAVNATGPMLAVQAMLPHLPRGRRTLVGLLGARVGSIGDNRLGGWYGYRAAKAALAMLTRTLAIELARTHPQLVVLMLHPGTVDSALSAPFQRGVPQLLTPDESARHLLAVLNSATTSDTGQHRDWSGVQIVA